MKNIKPKELEGKSYHAITLQYEYSQGRYYVYL